jgi:RNA polymerase sigma factor (sigma-70 family)
MGGDDFQEEAVLAAVKPLRTAESRLPDASDNVPRSGDSAERRGVLETLFRQHSDRVFRTAYRVTGNGADAEDVLQIVFLRLARSEEWRNFADKPEAYFARAAVNASLDLLRGRKRARAVGLDDAGEMTSDGRNPEAGHEDRELRNLIRVAVSRLASTAAQMFALRYFEGFDNKEIAKTLGTSPMVVGVTLHRARARLRKEIGSYLQKHST